MALRRGKSFLVEDDPLLLDLQGSRIPYNGYRNGYEIIEQKVVGRQSSLKLRRRKWRLKAAVSQDRAASSNVYVEYEMKIRKFLDTRKPLK